MKIHPCSGLYLALLWVATAGAQDNTSLTRSEVAALKNKLVAVQQAMGGDPEGYLKESEDFNLPTDFNPAQSGKFWPITSSISLRYTDRAAEEGQANLEKAAEEFQAKYAAALASGDLEAITKMAEEMTQLQTSAAAAAMAPASRKEPMQVYVQFNMNPIVGIDPDAVVLERPGVIALGEKEVSSDKGQVTVYVDPVALEATEELAKIELRTAQDGVANRTGVYHLVIQLNGAVADLEAWVERFDYDAMLAVFDPQ